MDNIKPTFLEWSNKAVASCHRLATNTELDLNLSFFAFQSIPKVNPDLLILGINPGNEFTYSDQYNNPGWGLDESGMNAEIFMNGNPFSQDYENWLIWKNLRKSFIGEKMNNMLTNSMYMNFIYFNSLNIESLLQKKGGFEAFNNCRDLSVELINNIIKPKYIICLGTADCFDKLPLTEKECLLKDKKRLLLKGKLSGIQVFGIPHPSGSITSDADRRNIGDLLNLNLV